MILAAKTIYMRWACGISKWDDLSTGGVYRCGVSEKGERHGV